MKHLLAILLLTAFTLHAETLHELLQQTEQNNPALAAVRLIGWCLGNPLTVILLTLLLILGGLRVAPNSGSCGRRRTDSARTGRHASLRSGAGGD